MKKLTILLLSILLIFCSACFFACDSNVKNESDKNISGSVGLEYLLWNNEYYVSGLGSCKDTDIVIPSVYNNKPVIGITSDAFWGDSLTSVIIPDSVVGISGHAFAECGSLTKVILGNGVKFIGNYAFWNCGLTEIIIPNGVTTIENSTFWMCSNLTKVIIPDSVISIGYEAFSDCSSLTEVIIPDSVISIGGIVFKGCSSLTSITFNDTTTWYRTTSSTDWNNKTGGTQTSVTSSSTNATYLKSTYCDYCWYKL